MLVMGVANVVIQLTTDIIGYMSTGKWNSSWEDYLGAFLGGVAGGLAFVTSGFNLSMALGVTGFVDNLFTNFFTNITGKTNYSTFEILSISTLSFLINSLGGKGLKLIGVTVGRNNFYAVYKTGLTKLLNKTASTMSLKVILKGIASIYTFKFVGTLMKGFFSSIDLSNLITKK